jgi:drug/metabolite transporter (DMT)-like permease
VAGDLRGRTVAAVLALTAAFLWATYYLFVLAVRPGTAVSAVLFYPFLGGAVASVAWVLGQGEGAALRSVFAEPQAYLRAGLLLAVQLCVLGATYLTGPVDASLLSLFGDVVATPLVVALLFGGHRGELGAPRVATGLVLSLAGGTLAIVGGHGLHAVRGLGWAILVFLPVGVAFFFVLAARAAARTPVMAVVAQVMVVATLGSFALSVALPGGPAGLVVIRAWPLALLLVNGLGSFFAGQLLYLRSIERAGLVFPPMLMTGIPVFTLLLSSAFLGLAPTLLALLGVPIAAVGGVLALGGAPPERGAN